MADVITRFKLETTQYDSKLRDAAKGLADYAHQASLAGKEFQKFTQGNAESARALGNIATSANNAKDKVKELVNAYNDVAKAYNALTKEQQQSDWGKALAESMQTLKGRIADAKAEMNSTGGIMGMLKDKLTINIDAIKLFNVGLSAAKAVLDVAKDAFFNNEQTLDEWGRTVESAGSLYNGFLNALNTGDISGYLQNIDNITKAARAAYDALDALNTFNAFNQINVEKTRTGMTEAIADYRGGSGSKDAVKAAGEAYKKELQERKKLEREAYIEAVGKVAAERGVSKDDLLKALSGSYGSYQSLKNIPLSGTQTVFYGGGMFGGGGSYEKAVPASVQEKLGDALRKLNDTELQSLQALGAQAERTGNEIASVDKQLTRVLNGKEPGAKSGGGRSGKSGPTYAADSVAAQQAEVQRLTKLWNEAGAEVRNSYIQPLVEAEAKLKSMQNEQALLKEQAQGKLLGGDIQTSGLEGPQFKGLAAANMEIGRGVDMLTPLENKLKELIELQNTFGRSSAEAWQSYQTQIEATTQQIDAFKGKNLAADGQKVDKSFQTAASSISSVGSALSGIEDPSAKILAIIAQAIAGVAAGAGQAVSAKDTTSSGWAWIGAAAAITASMISMIAQIHSATGYAQGGIVGGNSFSGDNVGPVMLDAGEVILNRAQQNNVAAALQSPEGGGNYSPSYISGEQIYVALNRYTKRTGKGELMTWR